MSGDSSLPKITFWSLQIRTVLKSKYGVGKQPSSDSLFPSSPNYLCSSPLPSPAPPQTGILRGAACSSSARGCHCLLGSPQVSHSPCPRSPGPTSQDPSLSPFYSIRKTLSQKPSVWFNLPDPDSPQNGSCGTQNGGSHMAFPAFFPSSHNPFCWSANPFVSPDSSCEPSPSYVPPPPSAPPKTCLLTTPPNQRPVCQVSPPSFPARYIFRVARSVPHKNCQGLRGDQGIITRNNTTLWSSSYNILG